jgi:hypothetical protein
MDGEELPYPGWTHILNIRISKGFMTNEDIQIMKTRVPCADTYAYSDCADLVVMHTRTSCTGVKPAMKNLAVFLKYS